MIRVYRNLHKNLFSVQEKVDGRWKVTRHADVIFLKSATFKVYQAGRARVLQEKRKNVHAYIIGEEIAHQTYQNNQTGLHYDAVTYNPYLGDSFYAGAPFNKVKTAELVAMFFVDRKPRVLAWRKAI